MLSPGSEALKKAQVRAPRLHHPHCKVTATISGHRADNQGIENHPTATSQKLLWRKFHTVVNESKAEHFPLNKTLGKTC